jgi:hypothetical protein
MKQTTTQAPAPAQAGGCGCKGHAHGQAQGQGCACCDLSAFVRPRYFCGHLLTDADLRLDQHYARAKRRLYHRTLHGHGVVCGLKLRCLPRCPGHIVVGEGYAIDPCGNDLVLDAPAAFDVMDWVRRRRAATTTAKPAPKMQPVEGTPAAGAGADKKPCLPIECYYVLACYHEEEADFTTPFVPGCQPAVAQCEATRVREGVRIDLTDPLPADDGWISALDTQLQKCFQLFSDETFKGLQDEQGKPLADVLHGSITVSVEKDKGYRDLYRSLVTAWSRQSYRLKDCLQCDPCAAKDPPADLKPLPTGDDARNDQKVKDYQQGVSDAFKLLLDAINDVYRAVQDCVADALVFACPSGSAAACVVLGSVEVQGDRLIRVCNCPRAYVWSFANLFGVLAATLLGRRPTGDGVTDTCCPTLSWGSWDEFLRGMRQGWTAQQNLLKLLRQWEAITKDVCSYPQETTPGDTLPPSRSALQALHDKLTTKNAELDARISALAHRLDNMGSPPPSGTGGGGAGGHGT